MNNILSSYILKTSLLIIVILSTLISLSIPILNMKMIDDGIIAYNYNLAVIYLISMVIGMIILDILAGLNYYIARYAELIDGFILQNSLYKKIHNLKNLANTKISLPIFTTDIDMMKVKGTSTIYLVGGIIKLLSVIILIYLINFEMMFITLCLILIMPIVPFVLSAKLPKMSNRILEKKSKFTNYIAETLNMSKEIRIEKLETQDEYLFKKRLFSTKTPILKFHLLNAIFNTNNLIYTLFFLIVVYIGINGIFSGDLTLGELTAMISFLGYSVNPVEEVIVNYNKLKVSIGSSKRYESIIQEAEFSSESVSGNSELDNEVIFKIELLKSPKIKKEINLTINKGEWLLISADSGRGKTSFMNILSKLDSEYDGIVKYKGNEIDTYSKSEYLENITYILQNHKMFNRSIADNELLSVKNYNKFNYYLKKLNIPYVIESKMEYSSLSGGEKQRLLLSLALEKDPEILLLDEPTAGLDERNRKIVIDLIKVERKDKLTIITSHDEKFDFITKKLLL